MSFEKFHYMCAQRYPVEKGEFLVGYPKSDRHFRSPIVPVKWAVAAISPKLVACEASLVAKRLLLKVMIDEFLC